MTMEAKLGELTLKDGRKREQSEELKGGFHKLEKKETDSP